MTEIVILYNAGYRCNSPVEELCYWSDGTLVELLDGFWDVGQPDLDDGE